MKSVVDVGPGIRCTVTITLENKKEIAAFLALAQSIANPAIATSIAKCAASSSADDVGALIDQLVTHEQFSDICDVIRR